MGVPTAPRLVMGVPNGTRLLFLKFCLKTETSLFFKLNEKRNAVFSKTCFFSLGKRGVRVLIKSGKAMFHFFAYLKICNDVFLKNSRGAVGTPINTCGHQVGRKNCDRAERGSNFYIELGASIPRQESALDKAILAENTNASLAFFSSASSTFRTGTYR